MNYSASEIIENYRSVLVEAGATNVPLYVKKLRENADCAGVFDDLLHEGSVARLLLANGFQIEFGDSPDLCVSFAEDQFYAEVKHFRLKLQDEIDEAQARATDSMVRVGDTMCSEKSSPWHQIVGVAERKEKQYRVGFPNILVIASSSHYAIDDGAVLTARNLIQRAILSDKSPGLRRLSGLLLIDATGWLKLEDSRGLCNVWYFPLETCTTPLPQRVSGALHAIQAW